MDQQKKVQLQNCYSRERLIEDLETEIARSKRYVKPLALMMVSIDWRNGQDQTIQSTKESQLMRYVVDKLTKNLRVIDRIYLCSEGYALLLPETDKVEALSTAKRLQKMLQQSQFSLVGGENNTSVKPVVYIGIASYPWDANTQEEMIKASSFALEQSRESTQGHICFLDFEYQHLRSNSEVEYKIRSV